METIRMASNFDDLTLDVALSCPRSNIKGIVQISHGMAEHKERYFEFMEYLNENGYASIINDHRGHGKSIKNDNDLGYFYTEDINGIVEDLHTVTKYAKERFPNVPVYLFSHSMGTLVARCYMEKYDTEIDKVILCGPPTDNPIIDKALGLAKFLNHFYRKKSPNNILNKLALGGYNKGQSMKNGWLSVREKNVKKYNADPLCGFAFTTNGFINLFELQKEAYRADAQAVGHPDLPIFVIAGASDPVIQSREKFDHLLEFLANKGYTNIKSHVFPGMRHEILNETGRLGVFIEILYFIEQ